MISQRLTDHRKREALGELRRQGMLAVFATHPIQYHVPIYRLLGDPWGIPVTVIYGSDFSISGYRDPEFGVTFSWDSDLLAGYSSIFLSRARPGEPGSPHSVSSRGMGAVLRNLMPDAVLLTGYSPRFHELACVQAIRGGYPILFRGETTDRAGRRGVVKSAVRDTVLRWLYRYCSRLLYVGRYSYEHFRRLRCDEDKLVFSPYCVDVSAFQSDDEVRDGLRCERRDAAGIPDEAILLLFSGKLVRRKAPELVIEAVRLLPVRVRDRIVVGFLGDGDLRGAVECLAAASPIVKVRFFGFQNQRKLSPFYHAADLLVLPSQQEPWGLVVNDALHHGLPCVASDAVGCAPDLIVQGETGETFTSGSVPDLAAAIGRALQLVGRSDVRRKCRALANEYSVEAAAEGIATAFHAVTGRRP